MPTGAPNRPRRRRAVAPAGVVVSLLLTACGADQGVRTIGAEESEIVRPVPTAPPGTSVAPTTAPAAPATTAPAETVPPTEPPRGDPELFADLSLGDMVDVDDAKPVREYDPFVAVAVADIERWWGEQFPAVYGGDFEPLANGIYAGYPERRSELPGCGEPTTSYEDLNLFAAFYCALDDFMIYDDGDDSLLNDLAEAFGPAVMGIVIAHEYGHAIQQRIGALDRFIATIYTEQQADCFAGAWTGQAYRGESPLLRLGDNDVRAGLIAMLEVRDPVGFSQFEAGGHGSAFDRVGAFQEGFVNGASRCAELLDAPLTLMPNEFQPGSIDEALGGNAVYDCEELRDFGATDEQIAQCTPAPVFLADDLNHFWDVTLDGEFPPLTASAVGDLGAANCAEGVSLALDAVLCEATDTVVYDEPDVLGLYREFGDFTLGYLYGIAWAERAQQVEDSTLRGEPRALRNDCYTGAWVRDITPQTNGLPTRTGDRDGDGVEDVPVTSSPGDLDEAIRMAILVGDSGASADIVGSPFEKIAAFRVGVLGGIDACRDRFPG